MSPRSLRFQLAATFLLVAVVPTSLVGLVALRSAVRRVEEDVTGRNQQLAEAVAGEAGRYLHAHLVRLQEVALIAADAPRQAIDHAAVHLGANRDLQAVMLLDRAGRVTAAVPTDPDLIGLDMSGQPAVREAFASGQPTWSQAATSIRSGQPGVTLVVPGPAPVMGTLQLSTLQEIAARSRAGRPGEAAILDRDGTFIAAAEARLVREQVNIRDVALVRDGLAGRPGTGEYRLEGRRLLGSVARVPLTSWLVLVSEPAEQALAPVARLRTTLLAALALAVGAAILAGALALRRILRPLRALQEETRRIAAGLPAPATPRPPFVFSELEELATGFDGMAAAVRDREAALARSEDNLRRIVASPLVGVARSRTADGQVLFCNEALARMLGYDRPEELVGRPIQTLYRDPAQRQRAAEGMGAAGTVANREVELVTRSGALRTMLLNLYRDGDTLVGMVVDVTEQRQAAQVRERLEQQLQQSQKLEAVGRLAGGVAHDFNNLLTAIVGDATLLLDELPQGHEGRVHVDGILDASSRAAHLSKSLLAFSRRQPLRPRPVDLVEVVRGVERLVRRVVGEDVVLQVELPGAPLPVVADPSQLEQVLVNLCTNARDAMPRGGRLRLVVDAVALDDGEAAARGLKGPGLHARLTVADTGEGIRPEDLPRVFEPFFTTKGLGRGTGLGLAIVDGIVRQHGGQVGLESRPGVGTTFTILLPLTAEAATAEVAAAPAQGPRGSETVLLAEDEPAVRRVVQTTLERAGYRVLSAEDGAQAVALYRARPGGVDLCLLDVMMPVMNGREAFDAIRLLDPGARGLFVSGYTADLLEQRGVGEGLPEVVPKPVAPHDLLARVRAALDRPRPRRDATGS